jgi:hypothetical protein
VEDNKLKIESLAKSFIWNALSSFSRTGVPCVNASTVPGVHPCCTTIKHIKPSYLEFKIFRLDDVPDPSKRRNGGVPDPRVGPNIPMQYC